MPSTLVTKYPTGASSSNRMNTSRVPSGEYSPGVSSPPGLDVIRVMSPPSLARTE